VADIGRIWVVTDLFAANIGRIWVVCNLFAADIGRIWVVCNLFAADIDLFAADIDLFAADIDLFVSTIGRVVAVIGIIWVVIDLFVSDMGRVVAVICRVEVVIDLVDGVYVISLFVCPDAFCCDVIVILFAPGSPFDVSDILLFCIATLVALYLGVVDIRDTTLGVVDVLFIIGIGLLL